MRIKIGCAFKKDVSFKFGYGVDCFYPLGKTPMVQITDYDPKKDWQLPLSGTKDVGNPKLKKMSQKDFNKTFEITSCQFFTDYQRYKNKVYYNKPKLRRFVDNKIILKIIKTLVWLRLA